MGRSGRSRRSLAAPGLIALMLTCVVLQPAAQEQRESSARGAQTFAEGVASLSSPRLRERQALRRELQKRGYSDVLYDFARGDALGALISYARVLMQVEWSIPHTTIVVYVPVVYPARRDSTLPGFTGGPSPPMAIPLEDDWSFPVDPWSEQ